MFGLTEGTRHYIKYDLNGNGVFEDLLFENENGESQGLWCSRAMRTAADKIAALIADGGTVPSQYKIVTRTWHEVTRDYDPNHGQAFNDSSYDYDADEDENKIVDADETDEQADASNDGQDDHPHGALDEDPTFVIVPDAENDKQ